jgi:hypothetical protein
MVSRIRILVGGVLLALAASGAFAALAWSAPDGSGDAQQVERVKVKLMLDQEGEPDRLELDDLGDMAVGETRSYSTAAGKSVLVTRDEQGWELDLDGKKIRVGEHGAGEGDVFVHRMKKFELGEDGEMKSMVFISGDDAEDGDVRIVREIGPHGAHAFAFGPHGQVHPGLGPEGMIDRLKENEKFQSLDAATQDLVIQAIRESAPKLRWIDEGMGEDGGKVIVLDVEKEVHADDDKR